MPLEGGSARTSAMALSAMALTEKKHHTSRGQRKDRAGGGGFKTHYTAVPGAPTRQPELFPVKSPAVPGHAVWVSRGGRRRRSSCAPWSSSPTTCPWYRFWIFLCRRWLNSCRMSCVSSTRFSRAGYRRAQDLLVIPSFSQGAQGAADGGAVGGCADCRVFFLSAADCRADH